MSKRNVIKYSIVTAVILAATAAFVVPSVKKFVAKAKQSEAKSTLAAIRSAQAAYFKEYKTYHFDFKELGYIPSENIRYKTKVIKANAQGYLVSLSRMSEDGKVIDEWTMNEKGEMTHKIDEFE